MSECVCEWVLLVPPQRREEKECGSHSVTSTLNEVNNGC